MTSLNADLMSAILAMDSYNRGYDQNIILKDDGFSVGNKIGNFTLTTESDVLNGSSGVNIGFYAAAYTYNNDTIISYRGTNDQFSVNDVLNEWDFSGLNDILSTFSGICLIVKDV